MTSIKYIAEYAFGRLILGGLGLLPLPVASFAGAILGGFLASLPINANKVARRNISIAFPEKTKQEIRHIQYLATQNFVQTILEMPALYRLSEKKFSKYITVKGIENIQNNAGALILTAHYGNWEIILKVFGHNKIPLAAIYRPANNPYIDKYITNMRTQSTGVMVPKGRSGGRLLIKAIREGMGAAFLNDQKMSDGIESVFFGQQVTSASAIADLALKYNRKVCSIFCTRQGYGKFTIIISKPIELIRTGNSKEDVSANIVKFNKIIEERICEKPGLWLWHHKRFPKKLK